MTGRTGRVTLESYDADAIIRWPVHTKDNLPERRSCAESTQLHAGSIGSLAPKAAADCVRGCAGVCAEWITCADAVAKFAHDGVDGRSLLHGCSTADVGELV